MEPIKILDYEHFPSTVYLDREGRNRFIGQRFQALLGSRVLNVGGGGRKHLAKWLPTGASYTEIDIDGQPDIVLNLERELPIPFNNRSFDMVVCTDVLEHIDNPHAVFDEICRLSDRHVLISLPNAWSSNKWGWLRGTGASGKFYGLPTQAPGDRHKWFFSFVEAERFLAERSAAQGFKPLQWISMGYVGSSLLGKLMRSFVSITLGTPARLNLFAGTIWVLLERVEQPARIQSRA